MKGPRAAEEQVFELALLHLPQQVSGEDHGAAAAAGPARVDVLGVGVEEETAAVVIVFGQVHAVPPEEVDDEHLAQTAQVAGDDAVVKVGLAAGVLEVGLEGGVGRRGHGGSHVVGVGDPLVCDFAGGHMGDIGSFP